eukprot:TRINITY_DN77865_c0_g1_i1.p1 TRINITY_DN77865_c0_g1~~TRINITY_DN77865_c0_g1_i1.p1  ORF type:complete len:250 (+),score=32.47 TRINITY_DN77865_c0_g1_i1:46-795(+)
MRQPNQDIVHMLLSAEQWLHAGPPPQVILDQVWLWKWLIIGLCAVLVLKVIVIDIAGALLTALLMGFATLMLKDGMKDMPKYALVYAVLCGLNFFFDLLPLLSELCGRTTRENDVKRFPAIFNGTFVTQYTVTTKVTSFFDPRLGFAYNAESMGMLLEPIFLALGCYLATVAHSEIQAVLPSAGADDFPDTSIVMNRARPSADQEARLRSLILDRHSNQDANPSYGQDTFLHFQGNAYKLNDQLTDKRS